MNSDIKVYVTDSYLKNKIMDHLITYPIVSFEQNWC